MHATELLALSSGPLIDPAIGQYVLLYASLFVVLTVGLALQYHLVSIPRPPGPDELEEFLDG